MFFSYFKNLTCFNQNGTIRCMEFSILSKGLIWTKTIFISFSFDSKKNCIFALVMPCGEKSAACQGKLHLLPVSKSGQFTVSWVEMKAMFL